MSDEQYALDLAGPVQHIAARLSESHPDALSFDDLAEGYTHFPGDLARVKQHEGCANDAEATLWLIKRAVMELTKASRRGRRQLVESGGWVGLASGIIPGELKWNGQKVYSAPNIHSILGDPFNPMSGRYRKNVRKRTGKDFEFGDLKMSMRLVGWLPGCPAVKDARTRVTISGHRRLQAAEELRQEGVEIRDNIVYQDFELDGEGDPADMHRMDTAYLSNFGFKPQTPEERAETALWLREKRGLRQREIATMLGVSQMQISRDLTKITKQMFTDLEPMVVIAMDGIERGLSQRQIAEEQGLADNSLVLAKAMAVAVERIHARAALAESAPDLGSADEVQGFDHDDEQPGDEHELTETLDELGPEPDEPLGDPDRELDEEEPAITCPVPVGGWEDPANVSPTGADPDAEVWAATGDPEETAAAAQTVVKEPDEEIDVSVLMAGMLPDPDAPGRPAVSPPPILPPAPVPSAEWGDHHPRKSLEEYQAIAKRELLQVGADTLTILTICAIIADAWADGGRNTSKEHNGKLTS